MERDVHFIVGDIVEILYEVFTETEDESILSTERAQELLKRLSKAKKYIRDIEKRIISFL